MKKNTAGPKRPYDPLKDTRRFCDGVRLHSVVGLVLSSYANQFMHQTQSNFSHTEFCRAAIPILSRLGLIVLIDPKTEIPEWLEPRDRRLAKRGGGKPIWMPTQDFSFDALRGVRGELRNNEIIWTKVRLPKRLRKRALN